MLTRRVRCSLQLICSYFNKDCFLCYGAGQVGGYVEVYDGLTFSTVRNAGHMVPYTQAERAYYMFSHWIHGKNL